MKEILKNKIEKLLPLYHLNGFIAKYILEEISSFYSSELATDLALQIPIGPGFIEIMDDIEMQINSISKYYSIDESIIFNPCFYEWYYKQIMRLEVERYKSKDSKEPFWSNWECERKVKNVLESLNNLEERILCLAYGCDNRKPKTLGMIARLNEFSCDKAYIEIIMHYIENQFVKCCRTEDAFLKVCNKNLKREEEGGMNYE